MVESRESRVESQRASREQFEAEGFTFARSLLTASEIDGFRAAVGFLNESEHAGARNLLGRLPVVAAFAKSERVLALLYDLCGARPFAVRGLLFDKTPQANWRVAWHQDLTIAVKQRAEVPGFGSWSVKSGIVHAQAPTEILARMMTLRIHLDDTNETNGALLVVPGSHRMGKLDDAATDRAIAAGPIVCCTATTGDALIMRPLLLHASSPALAPTHRRVVHLEYAVDALPSPLEWFEGAA